MEHLLRHKNPFFVEGPAGVMAFEVTWSDVVGMDYMSRLMENTRLVLEARHLVKRVFATVRQQQQLLCHGWSLAVLVIGWEAVCQSLLWLVTQVSPSIALLALLSQD